MNRALLNVANGSDTDVSFSPEEATEMFDARSFGYYSIDHMALQQNFSNN